MSQTKSLKVNSVINIIKTVLSIIFPLITFPYASRVLGVNGIGRVDYANSISNYFVLFAELGITTYAVREGAKIRENKEQLNYAVRLLLSILFRLLLLIQDWFCALSYLC